MYMYMYMCVYIYIHTLNLYPHQYKQLHYDLFVGLE